ncbi:8807_t:CDS:2 [Funneliformis geosporum]|nr:8807_t:CDS:2 [Funneliformis geosporum]
MTRELIEAVSNQSKLFGVIPYIDPIRFRRRRGSDNKSQQSTLNEKSDVYSIGVLLWEISSGRPPFYVEGESYDLDLAIEISQGLREIIISGTPLVYVKIYTECWDSEPDNRPAMKNVPTTKTVHFAQTAGIMAFREYELIRIIGFGIAAFQEFLPFGITAQHFGFVTFRVLGCRDNVPSGF